MCARVFFFLCKHRSNGALLWQWHLKPNSPSTVCIRFYVLCSNPPLCLCAYYPFPYSKCKRQNVQICWTTRIEVEDRNKNTHTYTYKERERERRNEGESALSHLWICHFATTVSVTFAKARNKVCVGMCVFMCIGRAWLWVCTCSVCALTYSDQISIIVCSRCYRVWDHACFLFPGFSLVCSPPSQDLCSTLNWLKMTR